MAIEALKNGHQPQQQKRGKPLLVGGVGKGTQQCTHDCTLPIALRSTGGAALLGTYTTPTINGPSNVTGILGLLAIRGRRGIIDTGKNKLYFPGPGGAQIQLSPGSETYDLIDAPSGHLLIPCCHYSKLKQKHKPEHDLTLYNRGNGATSSSSAHAGGVLYLFTLGCATAAGTTGPCCAPKCSAAGPDIQLHISVSQRNHNHGVANYATGSQ